MQLRTLDKVVIEKLNKESQRRFKRLRMAMLKSQQHIRRLA